MRAKILTSDIDQFELVTEITTRKNDIYSINLTALHKFEFIPAEFFELNIKYWFEEGLPRGILLKNLLKVPWSRRRKFQRSCGHGMHGEDIKIITDYLSNNTGPGSTYYKYL